MARASIRMLGKEALAALVWLTVAGCSSNVWIRPGTTQYQFSQDRAHCVEESVLPGAPAPEKGEEPSIDPDAFASCMKALGYEQVSKSSMIFR